MTASTTASAPRAMHTTHPLRALLPSPENVRKKPRPADLPSMALSIHAHGGLLQNLVVVPELQDGRRTGRAEVAAGQTRRQALCLLRDGGMPGAEGCHDVFAVPVPKVDRAQAVVASASENLQRTPMHLADQFEAFQTLREQCGSVEHVAAVFGVTELMVRNRSRPAAAPPSAEPHALVRIVVPDDVWERRMVHRAEDLPVGWNVVLEGKVTLDLGDGWLGSAESALLMVPSAIVPEEFNVLVNPVLADARCIVAAKVRRWTYDGRLAP